MLEGVQKHVYEERVNIGDLLLALPAPWATLRTYMLFMDSATRPEWLSRHQHNVTCGAV